MTTDGWTIAMACDDFAAAGIPVTPKQLGGIIRHLPGFTRIGELRKPAGSEGGRGPALYTIGELQELVTVLYERGWLVPLSGDA